MTAAIPQVPVPTARIWQKPGQEGRHENWEIVSCTGSEMVNKALHRRADGSTYTITAHLKKVE